MRNCNELKAVFEISWLTIPCSCPEHSISSTRLTREWAWSAGLPSLALPPPPPLFHRKGGKFNT